MSEQLFDLAILPATGTLAVGFSGGADSTALAHFLSEHVPHERIVLCHVNHLLRGEESDRDEAAARDFARSRGLRFAVLRVDIAEKAKALGIGVEECGRRERYRFFESFAPNENDRILTAHHRDDQAETVLLNLCRGAGLDGLCGISVQSGKLLRPLLHVSRSEIEQYCAAHNLNYVTDSTNQSTEYTRNFVRLRVLPMLRELNPKVGESIAQTAELLGEERTYLNEQTDELLSAARRPYGLSTEVLLAAHPVLRTRAVKRYLEQAGCKDLERKHYDAALACLTNGGAVQLPHGVTVRAAQGVFSAARQSEPIAEPCPLTMGENRLPNGKILCLEKKSASFIKDRQKINNLYFKNLLDCDTMVETPVARTRLPGDRFAPAGRGCSKPIKQIFQECGLPKELRAGAVLLEMHGQLVWCEGTGAAEGYQVTQHTKTVLEITVKEQERITEGNENVRAERNDGRY